MESTINARILLLKTQSGLTNLDWCREAKISHGTLHNIQKGENVQQKTINTLCESLNLNKTWLMTGEGPQYNPAPKDNNQVESVYRDAYIADLRQQIQDYKQLLQMALGGRTPQPGFKVPQQNSGLDARIHVLHTQRPKSVEELAA